MPHTRGAAQWWHDFANLALSGGNLLILLLGFKLQSRIGWQITLGLVRCGIFVSGAGRIWR